MEKHWYSKDSTNLEEICGLNSKIELNKSLCLHMYNPDNTLISNTPRIQLKSMAYLKIQQWIPCNDLLQGIYSDYGKINDTMILYLQS